MSAIQPTGRVVRDRAGLELIVQRRIHLSASELWEWLTAPKKLSRWIGNTDVAPRSAKPLASRLRARVLP